RSANGVSELHGQVSREMWKGLYSVKSVDQVPIGHITNGIHVLGWMKGPVRRFWRRRLSDGKGADPAGGSGESTRFWKTKGSWEADVNSQEFWDRMGDPNFISD